MGRTSRAEQRRRELERGREAGAWFALPLVVLRSEAFCQLSTKAVKLLFDLLSQFNGRTHNNGDLSAAWRLMKLRGWKSKDTLASALRELLDKKWLVITRQGGRHVASLYAVTFHRINDCGGKLDVKPTATPPGGWDQDGALRGEPAEMVAIKMKGAMNHAKRAPAGGSANTVNDPPSGLIAIH